MGQKFIKLTTKTEEFYINPLMITSIKKSKDNDNVIINLFDQRSISPQETLEEVMKKIKEANQFKFEL